MSPFLVASMQVIAGLAIAAITSVIVFLVGIKVYMATQNGVNESLKNTDSRLQEQDVKLENHVKDSIQKVEEALVSMKGGFDKLGDELRAGAITTARFVEVVVGIQKQNEQFMHRFESLEGRVRSIEVSQPPHRRR